MEAPTEDKAVIETEANVFALALLMPRDRLREDVREMGGYDLHDHKALRKLADRYKVDPMVMAFRLGMMFGQIVGGRCP